MPKLVDHAQRRVDVGEALLRVLAKHGIDQVSIRSVASEAGWSRGVVEHYFADRDDLLLFAYRLSLRREAEIAATFTDSSPIEKLVGSLLRALPVDDVSELDFRIFLGLLGRLADRPELAASLREDHRAYEARVLANVQLAVESGHLRRDIPIQTMATLLSTHVDGLGIWSAIHPQESSLETLETKVLELLKIFTVSSNSEGQRTQSELAPKQKAQKTFSS